MLTIPATHWMEAVDLMPTGKIVDLKGSSFDARSGISLENFVVDDVYFGLEPKDPVRIDFQDVGLSIRLNASKQFTHLVVYTPDKEPFFCVENQTCSTDAHNLYERGLKRESNLLICKPHSIESGWAEFEFQQK
jgi:aldose 1-epimerase